MVGRIGEVDSTGEDIDVDAYIDFKINKVGNFLVSSKNFVGFDIILAIDESSSMSKNMDTVKRMCATLYDCNIGFVPCKTYNNWVEWNRRRMFH